MTEEEKVRREELIAVIAKGMGPYGSPQKIIGELLLCGYEIVRRGPVSSPSGSDK